MIHYINYEKKKLCGRNNQPNVIPLIIDYSTVENVSFQFIDCNNRILDISGLSGLYFAGSLQMAQPSYDLLFLSKDYTIENNVLTFTCDTYTRNYLDKIRKKQTLINIEIGQISLDAKKVMMRETALANPRVYVEGLSPQEIDSHEYWTIEETQQAIDEATSGVVTKDYVDEQDQSLQSEINGLESSKQDIIDASHNLSYDLLSGTPTIPEKLSDLQNDEDFVNEQYVENAVSGKADKTELEDYQLKVTKDAKLGYDLLSGTPSIPEKTSDLVNNSDFATSGYVQAQVSGKADESALTAHTSNTSIHTTSDEKEAWNNKQDNIDSLHKLDYGLISGAPTVPTKTSDLTNDSDYQTGAQVQAAISGKADKSELEDYQPLITATEKLDYALLSGTFPYDPVNVTLEMKTASVAGTFTGSFEGKQIQKWVYTDATSGTITIAFDVFSSTATDIAPTIEMHIGLNGNVSTITLPAGLSIVDIPDSLTYNGQTASDIDYHVFVLRAERDMNAAWKFYINYAYDYIETIA